MMRTKKHHLIARIQARFPQITGTILDRDDDVSERAARELFDAFNGAAAKLGLPRERLTKREPNRLMLERSAK